MGGRASTESDVVAVAFGAVGGAGDRLNCSDGVPEVVTCSHSWSDSIVVEAMVVVGGVRVQASG